MTYEQLQEWLNKMTPQQLAMQVTVYAGDIDDVMPVIGFGTNSAEEMGESLEGVDTTQPLILI